jgi:hypothetical protein
MGDTNNLRVTPAVLAATAAAFVVGLGLGHWTATRPIMDTQARSVGAFGQQTKRVLSATVESLRAENKLIVYQYTGETRVSVERAEFGGWLKGTQELIVPATVSYLVDMSQLSLQSVDYDERARTVRVKLPPLQLGTISFQPERARQTNGGLLSLSPQVIEDLSRENYANARRAFTAQAQQVTLVELARVQARKTVEAYFAIPLRATGVSGIKVEATF